MKKHLQDILKVMYKYYDYEDAQIQSKVAVVAELLGIYIETDFYIPILL